MTAIAPLAQRYGSHYTSRVLAAIKFTVIDAAKSLTPYIKHYWLAQIDSSEPYCANTYPDACVGLVFDLDCHHKSHFQSGLTSTRKVTIDGNTRQLGVRFSIGGASAFIADFAQYGDESVSFDTPKLAPLQRLSKQLLACSSTLTQVQLLDGFFIGQLNQRNDWLGHHDLAKKVEMIEALLPDSGRSISDIAEQLGVSQRQLNRLFRQHIAYTPKQVMAIFRTDAARRLLSGKRAVDMQDLIYQLGYYDQAHFIKEFKGQTLLTPCAYFTKKQGQLWSKTDI